jgi:hypothetical protein
MANSQTAFLAHDQVPTRQALHDAIKGLRFRLTLDDTYVPFGCAGYVPCTLDGEDAGFDIKFSDSAGCLADMPQLQGQLGDRDAAVILRWGGDPRERISALIVAAVLADRFGAQVHRPGEAVFRPAEQLLDEARQAFARLQEP